MDTSLNVRNFVTAANETTLGGSYQLLVDNGLNATQLGDISFLNSDSSQFGAVRQQIATGVNSRRTKVNAAGLGSSSFPSMGRGALSLREWFYRLLLIIPAAAPIYQWTRR